MIRHLWEIPLDVVLLGLLSVPWRCWREERAYRKDFERLRIHELAHGAVVETQNSVDALLKSVYRPPVPVVQAPVPESRRVEKDAEFARRIAARKLGERLERVQISQKDVAYLRARERLEKRGFVVAR